MQLVTLVTKPLVTMKVKAGSFNPTVRQNLNCRQGCKDGPSHGLLELIQQQSLLSAHFSIA